MEHQGVQYTVVQTANPTGWKWTIVLANGKTRTGSSFSRTGAIKLAIFAINKADTASK
jgi:hypothetical protein